jgi:chromosome partitioning protein
MARKISFINYKGGVGKTSCVVNVAACLAAAGKRVLLCDLDTQSNSSVWLMRLDRWNALNLDGEGTVFSLFDPGVRRMADIVVRDVVVDREGTRLLPGLDLVPTSFNLIDLEQEYQPPDARPVFLRFREQLAEIEDAYDYILFDCPPNLMRAAQCGLFSSNEVIVPSNPDALSLIGFTLLTGKLQQFNERSASFRMSGMGTPARITGVIFNAIKANVDIKVPVMRMQFRLNQFREQRKVAAHAKIFRQQIRDATLVRRAVTLGLPVCCLESASGEEGVLEDYKTLAREIDRHQADDGPYIDRLSELSRP